MSVAYSDLETEIAGYLQIDTDDVDKFAIEKTVNRAQLLLLNVLPATFLMNAVKTKRLNLIENEDLQYPTDLVRTMNLWIDYAAAITATNTGRPVRIVQDMDINQAANVDLVPTTDFPLASMGAFGGWELRPIPSANVTEGLRVKYIMKLPTISATQPCILQDNLVSLLVFVATSYSATVNNYSREKSDRFWEKFMIELQMMAPKIHKRVEGSHGYLRNFVGYQELLRNPQRG